jgi:UDP-N-acetylmuramoyl-tripeptide--D-alanyl-D-alanine ligase
MLTAAEIAAVVDGETDGSKEARVESFAIDTRRLEPGACFVALRAERDGHDFLPDAWARGATVALVGHPVRAPEGRATVRVTDPLHALGALGADARALRPEVAVVGVTGSAGKTATKDLLAAALAPVRAVHASPESYNNEAGVPLTLLGAPEGTEVVVVEMGARGQGHIAALCAIARPDVAIITNVGLAHAGLLGGREGVARAKGELLDALPGDGLAVLEAEGEYTAELLRRTTAPVVLTGIGDAPGAVVRAANVQLDDELRPRFDLSTPWGRAQVRLGLRGAHQVMNALMAAAVAGELGVPVEEIAAGLAAARSGPWRMELVRGRSGIVVLNDAYNASPGSMAAALQALARLGASGRRLAVLGEMRELGAEAEAEHRAVGRLAGECGVDVLVLVGPGAHAVARGAPRELRVLEVADAGEAATVTAREARAGDVVLVKASRAVGLESLASVLADAGTSE